MKLYISPHPSEYAEDGRGSGGIWRVVNAQARWLPEYGVELVDDPKDAEIVAIHAGSLIDTKLPIVQHLHGYYWTGDFAWPREYWEYNRSVIEVSRRARAITAPADWVAVPVRRDLRKSPVVIPHGIDADGFEMQRGHRGYVLWGKPRVDVVCDPAPVNELAARAPNVRFVTTFGRQADNVEVVGPMPYDEFQDLLSGAAVWLATARETGDIGSREAMIQGIPVLGWNWGATAELVRHGETGYLAEVGDYSALLDGLRYCLENRKRLGDAARADVLGRFQWRDIMRQYAAVYRAVLEREVYPVEVSVVVPTYNYAHFLPECLDSIEKQTFAGKMEVIIVDDASTDDTREVLDSHIGNGMRAIQHERNSGLCASLNTGHTAARGRYIINVDADNLLPPGAIETLYNALEEKPWVDVASGGLAMYSEDGNHQRATDWPFGKVDPLAQLNHINQLPSSSMMRASSIRRLGGYRLRQRKNEDGEWWCRAISAGLWFEQVTDDPVLVYRWHGQNKSVLEGGEDNPDGPLSWNFHYPWKERYGIMPFAATVRAAPGSWAVRSYDRPHIAVVIPCGPGHQRYLVDALDSVIGQTYQNFECIVANDTGEPLDIAAMGHPWVKVVNTKGRQGPAIARNTAIAAAQAPLILPLDADDMLYPNTLLGFYEAWLQHPDSLVYGDCEIEKGPGEREHYESGRWTWEKITQEAIFQVTTLFAKQWWEAVGGYPTDQTANLWEDWLFAVKLHIAGVGATYVQKPWGVYRHWTAGEGGKSKNDIDNADFESPEFQEKLRAVAEWIGGKEQEMPCPKCRGRRKSRTMSTQRRQQAANPEEDLVLVYEGDKEGAFNIKSRAVRGRTYRIQRGQTITVPPEDGFIAQMDGFRQVAAQGESPKPSLPFAPPSVPPIELQAPQPAPVTSFAEDIREAVAEVVQPANDGVMERIVGLRWVEMDSLHKAGFEDVAHIKQDLLQNGGEGLLAIRGIGPSTLNKIREIALA